MSLAANLGNHNAARKPATTRPRPIPSTWFAIAPDFAVALALVAAAEVELEACVAVLVADALALAAAAVALVDALAPAEEAAASAEDSEAGVVVRLEIVPDDNDDAVAAVVDDAEPDEVDVQVAAVGRFVTP